MDNINSLIRKTTDIDVSGVANLNLKDTDVVQIWEEISSYIERLMSQTKGVSIPGFGTFSFVQKKIDIGNNKHILSQRPVFAISEKFAQTHALNYTKYPVAGNVPVHPLNYTSIAQETAFTRDDIESCVRHVLLVFNRSVQSRKNIEFTFNGIGKLQIRNSKVKMKFFKEFVNLFDSSGKLVAEMQNRPNTADSVMSRNEPNRPHTRNTCVLPRLNSRAASDAGLLDNNAAAMDTINEENQEEIISSRNQIQEQISVPVASVYSSSDDAQANNSNSNSNNIDIMKSSPTQTVLQVSQLQPTSISQIQLEARAVSASPKYRIPDPFTVKTVTFSTSASNPALNQHELEAVNMALNDNNNANYSSLAGVNNLVRKQETPQLIRPSSKNLLTNLTTTNLNSTTSTTRLVTTPCGHHNAGQELCYLCHQRQRRNIPVYLHDEIRQKDQEETQLLMQYQQMKDLEKQLKDEEKRNVQRLDRAKIDAFNLGVTEAIKAKKRERPKTSDISRSFVFRKRCRTPPKFYKQQELNDYLSKQIEYRQKESQQTKQDLDYIEKMEQMKLAEDLSAQREAYLKEKFQRQRDLKDALDSQVKNKPLELPKALPDSEVFGLYDCKNEKLAAMKRRELDTFKFHKELIEQRKREQLLRQVKEQELDAENIERVKEEYRIDLANRYKRMQDMRKNLEKDWSYANEEKQQRDHEEKEHRMATDGVILHEQCDKYRRCAQCKRDLKNCGESNVWQETRYVAGTRLMV